MTTETRFLGLGAMGSALAQTALESGRPIVVWNRTPERTAGWAERGATVARSLTEAVSGDGVIVVCLLDHASVRQVLTPVVDALAGRTVVNLTTTTSNEARDLAAWLREHHADHLDGAVMTVPEMIGKPGATVLYSGAAHVFAEQRSLFDLWAASEYLGEDDGLASLYDMAMLAGMYTMFAGFLHGAAMVSREGISAMEFARRAQPFMAAMTKAFAGYAATVDAGSYRDVGQSLEFTEGALATVLRATRDQDVTVDVLQAVHDLVRRQIDAGHGAEDTARIYEELRSAR